MKKLIVFLIVFSNFLAAQTYNFRNLEYQLPKYGAIKNIEQMQSITFDDNGENIIILNYIPNTNLPNFNNLEYRKDEKQAMFLKNQAGFIQKILEVKNNDIQKSNLLMQPRFLFNNKIYYVFYSIKNILEPEKAKQQVIEFYFIIPDLKNSYLITVTSFANDSKFAYELDKFLNSLNLR